MIYPPLYYITRPANLYTFRIGGLQFNTRVQQYGVTNQNL